MIKLLTTFLFSFCIFINIVSAQSIKGKIIDAHTKAPLQHVTVTLANTALGTMSDEEGRFQIRAKTSGVYLVRATRVGYEALEVSHTTVGAFLEVALKPALIQLNNAVVVSAQRYPVNEFGSPEVVSVVNEKRLVEMSPGSVPEALVGTTGVWMQKTNHGGGSPFIRGLTGQQTLLMIDGIRLNNATYRSGPNQYLNTVDPFNVEQIEVLRGSGSVQYGSDALGGVVQIFTQTPKFSQGTLKLFGKGYGKYLSSNMEQSAGLELDASSEKLVMSGNFVWRKFGDIKAGKDLGTLHPTGYGQLAGEIKSVIKLHDKHLLTLAYQQVSQDDVPLFHKVALEDFQYNNFDLQKRQLGYVRLESYYNNKWIKKIQYTGSLQMSDEGRESKKNGSETVNHERDKINTWGATALVHSEPSAHWKINSGLEYYYDQVSSSRYVENTVSGSRADKRPLYPDGSTLSNIAFFTLHTLDFNKFTLTGGARLNGFDIQVREDNTNISTVRLNPVAVVGSFSALYKIHSNHHVIASINNAFRAPNIDDLGTLGIVDFRYEVPNKSLEPERSVNMELGIKSRTKHFSSSFSVYRNNLTNIIDRVRSGTDSIQGYQVYLKENIAEAYIQGFESGIEVRLTDFLVFRNNLTYTYGQNITKNEPYRRIPPFNGLAELTFRKKIFWATFNVLFASKQDRLAGGDKDDNRIPEGGTPGWKVLNLNVGHSFKNWCMLTAGMHNILDEAYRTHGSGVYGYGRSVWAALRVNLN
ncbi:MAG: TonB-dependent receptor [Bacteroidota bacterium]|nr:TonB-dependent receptor [Bacteroidota bacterium]